MSLNFDYTYTEVEEDIMIFNLSGEVTESVDNNFKRIVHEKISGERTFIIFNMRDIRYINSSGLGLIAGLLKDSRKNKGDIKLCEVQPVIRNILQISKLDKVFDIFDSYEEALKAVRNSKDRDVY
ncbi:MAG: STAS domain-containing protein [Candidatus Muiribacteriaceae bacterium]